jgi:hypothetical protein
MSAIGAKRTLGRPDILRSIALEAYCICEPTPALTLATYGLRPKSFDLLAFPPATKANNSRTHPEQVRTYSQGTPKLYTSRFGDVGSPPSPGSLTRCGSLRPVSEAPAAAVRRPSQPQTRGLQATVC